ncbi:MAG TPA: cell surface protein SprA, partial [Cyclobacteriaceae bacterium]
LTKDGFQLRVIYRDDNSGIDNPQLQEPSLSDRQLIEIMGLDKLNPVNDPQPDGNFDYVEGITINSAAGLIMFPYLEPLNTALRAAFKGKEDEVALVQKYVYDTLYRSTKADAERYATKNKFFLTGLYSAGSSKVISIPGFGVSQGSVKVFAGGVALVEGTDYTVDYTFGQVTMLNESILSSGKNISVQYEQADPFSFQTRSLLGTRLDYKLNDDINLGSTLLYYNERPLVSRNAVGTEPARNIQYGLDFNMHKNSRILTKIVDALPFLQTKEVSTVNFNGEFAQLIPGTSNVIDGQGTGYIDDFENTATPYSLLSPTIWKLSSIPKTADDRYGSKDTLISAGYQRAKLAWYTIDNVFYRTGGQFRPSNITSAETEDNHYTRQVGPQEIFKNKNRTQGNFFEQVLDLAYYPSERGPYNYRHDLIIDNTTNDVKLPSPEKNWAGITTAIRTEVDFDKANIEYVEFWLLDPFIDGQYGKIYDGKFDSNNTTGGKLIFQLGSISEDVARDSRQAFENGLPANGIPNFGDVVSGAQQNNWGYVTTQQFVLGAFDNASATARKNQDVGFDGLPDETEGGLFGGSMPDAVKDDPSADNFRYYLGSELDRDKVGILGRYKNVNGQDGNTPIITATDLITPSGSTIPDNEDINADNTLSELEEYYEYQIDLRKGQLATGKKYIVDQVTTDGNGDQKLKQNVTWYLYRIPIRDFESQYGNLEGFKSIKYARMILTGWKEPVVLRMANFRMVGSKWLQNLGKLHDGGLYEYPEPKQDDFTLSVVNLEENAQADPNGVKSPYVIPPGVVRDRDNTSTIYRQVNEQSVQICVDELQDGDARAIYKNVTLDIFNYGRVKMYFHADSKNAKDGELYGMLRLGTDADQNYYEIQVPLKISHVSNPNNPDKYEVWPEENNISISLKDLYELKADRDREGAALNIPYPQTGPRKIGDHHFIRVAGRPDLSAIRLMIIGVRNPTSSSNPQNITACVWANELRVTEFNRTAGWAMNSSLNVKLADFATLNGTLRYTTFGFGGVSSKISERSREETTHYDLSANVNLDKLLPGNTGIKLPMYVSYGKNIINPNYDPANPDTKLGVALQRFSTDQQRADFKKLIQDQTTQRSINFVNVRKTKVKPDAVTHIYDIENLAFSYSYRDAIQSNYSIKEALQKEHKGSVAYTYSTKGSGIEPFKDFKFLKSPWLKLIKDFNFSLMPASIGVRGDLERSFNKKTYRTAGTTLGELGTAQKSNYMKYFTFNRTYNVRWNLTKSLSLEVSALANAIIDEPDGDIDTPEKRNVVITNLKKFGRMKAYNQNFTINYMLPLDKLPLTDFLGAEYRYQASYAWKAGPKYDTATSLNFGNIIQNTRDNNATGKIDLTKLYNKIKFLKELNTPPKPIKPLKPGERAKVPVDTTWQMPSLMKGFFRLLMALRSINASYTLSEGTILPGFDPSPKRFGMDENYNAPGWGFILGSQDPSIRQRAARNGWLTQAAELTNPFTQFQNKTLDIKGNVEISPDVKIQLNIHKENTTAYQEIFRFDNGGWASLNPSRTGSYKISFITIRTAFDKTNNDKDSKVFHKFENNLAILKTRLGVKSGSADLEGTSQDVAVAAFITTYTGKNASRASLSSFPKIPLPNWRLDYTGLTKLDMFKDAFQSITLSHSYSSSYSVSNYSNSLQYDQSNLIGINVPIEDYNDGIFGRDIDGKYVPIYVLGQVFLSEQFSPLFGVNVRSKNRLTGSFQYKKKRDLALNISNAQITEINSKDVSVEFGLTKNNVKLPFKAQGETIILKNDVTFRLNLSLSDNLTIQRKVKELNTITSGNTNIQIKPNISYVVNQKLNIQAYFERTINDPKVSNNYRRTSTRFGIQIRFSLSQ